MSQPISVQDRLYLSKRKHWKQHLPSLKLYESSLAKNLRSPMKIIAQKLDNRITEVLALQYEI